MARGKGKQPTRYSDTLAQRICERLANGETLTSICKSSGMPTDTAVRKWALNAEHPFSSLYARAREIGYHKMADDILDIADDGKNDWVIRAKENGDEVLAPDQEHMRRSQLRIETRKWLLAKALPKVYGDKSEVNVTGDHKVTHVTQPVSATADWLTGVLGRGQDSALPKPVLN